MVKLALKICLLMSLLVSMPQLQASSERIVYHVHQAQQDTFKRTINNLENLKKGMPNRQMDMRLLIQGNSIQLLNPSQQDKGLMARLSKLHDSGLHIEVSEKNYRRNRLQIDSSLKPELVENIFSRLIELQKQGYRYLTP